MTETTAYAVTGMTCTHCTRSVQEEVAVVPGVERVDVDLATGRLTVAGAGIAPAAVRAAVADAGYRVIT